MADLYINPQGYVNNNQVPLLTGNEKADAYLNTLPAEQRQEALKRLTAPLTGEEIAQKLHNDTEFSYTPTKQEFDAFNEYQSKKETNLFDGMSMFADAAGAIYDIAGNVISSIYDHPLEDAVKLAPSLLEGGTQNIRNWYGMLAQSQDPSSVLFKWKNVLARDGSDSAYKQFLEARQFAKESVDYETGAKTMLVSKDYIDPALTQAATIIVDPMFYGSFLVGAGEVGIAEKVAQVLGMSERLAKAGAFAEKMKGAVYGGALKMAGVPLEFIGDITRGTIDKVVEGGSAALEGVTGVSAQELKTAARVGGFGSIGFGVPYLSPTSKVYLGAGFAAGMGEALSATGEQIMKNGGKRGLLSFAEQAIAESDAMLAKGGSGLSPQARKLLNVLDKADPMLSYTGAFMEGGAHGAVIGAGLGYLGGGEEGAYSGAGAGFGIGSLGGLAGRAAINYKGGLEKQRLAVQMDMLMPMLKDVDPTTHSSLELMREANKRAGNPDWVVDRYIVALDKIAPDTKFRAGGATENEALLKSKGQDPKTYDGFERDAKGEYVLDKDGNKVKLRDAEGFTIPTMEQYNAAGWTLVEGANGKYKVHINTDKYSDIGNTLPHEMFHGIFRELGMKNEFKDRIAEHILGTFDKDGKQIKPPSISKYEAEGFFSKYINNAYTGAERDERLAKLKEAVNDYYTTGKMNVMESDGKTPVLASLTEEFGAYYWTHFLNDKPVDYLFRGGQLNGMRGVLDSVKNKWQDYMERKVGGVNGGFDFAREQYLNPAFRDKNGKRIRVGALDYMMEDLIRTKSAASKGQGFDFNKLSPDGQEAYVRASGNSTAFEPPKVKGGKWKVRTEAQQKAVRAKNAGAMHTGLEAFAASNPEALIIKDANGMPVGGLTKDADGNFVGHPPDAIVDYFIKSGHIDAIEGARIKLLRDAAMGLTDSNVFEFNQYTGDTMNIGIGKNIRVKSPFVATKDRIVILTKFEAVVGKGDYGFYAHTLDYRHLLVRQDAMWKDPKVRAAWGDDKDAFTADLFRYFKNASQPDGVRLPSAQLWTENGEYKRNVLHQVAGLETPATGTINKSLGDIKGDMFSTYRKFRTDRMTGERMSGEKIDFNGDNATDYIRYNMMPSEMAGETTPNGKIFTHPNGYKFFQVEAGFKAHKPDGTVIGTFKTLEEATAKADVIYQKENPAGKPIPSVDNIRQEPFDAPETQEQYVARKMQSELESNKDLQALAQDPNADPAVVQSSVEAIKVKLADEYNVQNVQAKPISLADSLNEQAGMYGWRVENGVLYNDNFSTPRPIHKVEIKGKRIRLFSLSDNKLRGSLSEPSSLGQYLEKTFYAELKPEQKAGRSQTFMMPSEGEQGGRKYSSKELKGSFIGKQAQEKPELTDGIKLSYRSWDTEEGATEGRKLIILTRSSDGAEIGRIDFDYTNLTKHGMKSRGFGDKDGIVVDGISVNVNKRFQGKGYQHILYSEMYERARAMGATGFSQEIENAKGLPLKSVNKVIGESNHSIASLSEPTAQKPTQENFNRLIENAPAIESNYHSNLLSVQNWGKIDPNARYMPSEGEQGGRKYSDAEFNGSFIGKYAQKNPELIKGLEIKYFKTNVSTSTSAGYPSIEIHSKDKKIGEITFYFKKDYDSKSNNDVQLSFSQIDKQYRGKGLGKLLYSELFERLRSIGVNEIHGGVGNPELIPLRIRQSIVGNTEILDQSNGIKNQKWIKLTDKDLDSSIIELYKKYNNSVEVRNILDPRAHYMPSEQAQAWRDFKAEPTTEGNSIFKNAMNFVIIQANNKYKVYNPQKALLGIYTDLDGAKRRVQREEPKQR